MIHVICVCMQRMQLLFPDPMMERLKTLAREQERSVSEIVRRSIEEFLKRCPAEDSKMKVEEIAADLGKIRIKSDTMREVLYGDE